MEIWQDLNQQQPAKQPTPTHPYANFELNGPTRLLADRMPTHENITLDAQPSYPYQILAKKYTSSYSEPSSHDEGAYTLIFLHAVGMHKESWDLVVDKLFQLEGGIKIKEVFSIECPNHGESAVVNEDALRLNRFDPTRSVLEYARAVHLFLTSESLAIDFSKRRLIGIGHSLGSPAL